MKAWQANSEYSEGSVVVFAEYVNKAKSMALHTDILCYENYKDLRVARLPKIDHLYNGQTVVDWNEDEDIRLALVKEYGWHCIEPQLSDCKVCSAEKYCEWSLLKGGAENEL